MRLAGVLTSILVTSLLLWTGDIDAACKKGKTVVRPYLTLDFGHGGVKDEGYTFSTRLVPTLAVGKTERLRVSAMAGLSFVHADWNVIGGARVAYRVLAAPLDLGGLDLFVEGAFGDDARQPLGVGVSVDLGTVALVQGRTGFLGGPGHAYYETGAGMYLYRPPPRGVEPLPSLPDDPTVYQEIEERAATRLTAFLLDDEGRADCETVSLAERASLMAAESLAEIQANLHEVGLHAFAEDVPEIVSTAEERAEEQSTDPKAAQAFRRGMREAVITILEEED